MKLYLCALIVKLVGTFLCHGAPSDSSCFLIRIFINTHTWLQEERKKYHNFLTALNEFRGTKNIV